MTNLEIAQSATLLPMDAVAERAGLAPGEYEPLGRHKAKLTWKGIERLRSGPLGKLVLVTAVTPTPAGEGKTTVTVGLAQGLNRRGVRAAPAIREPSLGPIFGTKGGACGGGYSQVLPMEDINLFFTGDYPAVQAAHSLLSAMVDAHLHHGNALGLDTRRAMWPRAVDMNDRALREVVVGLGGPGNGFVRQDGFVITAASEVMAVLALARDLGELRARLGDLMVGMAYSGAPVQARDIRADGAMTVLLKDALRPNLVQTIEGGPAFVHAGPFANIAHGCSSALATLCSLGMNEVTVTEAGFASDLGAQKFMSLVAPRLGKDPDVIVLVATVRALRHHGDGDLDAGLANLRRHVGHLFQYGLPVVVAVNQFSGDSDADLARVVEFATGLGVEAVVVDPWSGGGAGCDALAELVLRQSPAQPRKLFAQDAPFDEKLGVIVRQVYGGAGFELDEKARRRLDWAKKHNLDRLPICIAKTQNSLSDDASLKNAPEGFTIRIREVRPSLGAGYLVAVSGEILLMPGLGKQPAAFGIDLDAEGQISGLF